MINPSTLSQDIIYTVGNAVGAIDVWPERKLTAEEMLKAGNAIQAMTPAEAFNHYCTWHGLIGWASRLTSVIEAIQKAEVKK